MDIMNEAISNHQNHLPNPEGFVLWLREGVVTMSGLEKLPRGRVVAFPMMSFFHSVLGPHLGDRPSPWDL